MTDLTEIPGIGPKTAESLRAVGVDTAERLCVEYLTGESSVVDALHSERRLVKYFFSGNPPVIDHGVGPVNDERVSAVVGFARHYGASHRYLAPRAPYNMPADEISVGAVDWRAGLLGDERDVLGVVYDIDSASNTIGWELQQLSEHPKSVSHPSDGIVQYESDDSVTLLDSEVIERAESVTGRDYDDEANVMLAGDRDGSLVRLETGVDGVFLLVAPRVSA